MGEPRNPAASVSGLAALFCTRRLVESGAVVKLVWPGEGGPDAYCGWDGYSPGYSGASDRFSWTIGGITVSRGGEYAEDAHGGAQALKGGIVRVGGGEGR